MYAKPEHSHLQKCDQLSNLNQLPNVHKCAVEKLSGFVALCWNDPVCSMFSVLVSPWWNGGMAEARWPCMLADACCGLTTSMIAQCFVSFELRGVQMWLMVDTHVARSGTVGLEECG